MHTTREAARASRHRVTASKAGSVATASKSTTVTATATMPSATVLGKRGCAYSQERRQGTNCPQ